MDSPTNASSHAPTIANVRGNASVVTSGHVLEEMMDDLGYTPCAVQSVEKPSPASENSSRSESPQHRQQRHLQMSVGTTTGPTASSVADSRSLHSSVVSLPHAETDAPRERQKRERERKAATSAAFHPFIMCTLNNLGNTCYFNSGMQILCNCPAFVFALRDSAFTAPTGNVSLLLSRTSTQRTHGLYRAIASLLMEMEYQQGKLDVSLSPSTALNLLGDVYPAFEGRRQQDCPEMIAAVLGNTEDEGRQDVEVDVLLRGFESDARATAGRRAAFTNSLPPAVRALQSGETLASVMAATTSAVVGSPTLSSNAPRRQEGSSKEPFTPAGKGAKQGKPARGGRAARTAASSREATSAEARRLADEEMSTGLPTESGVLAMPGPWSAHEFAALRLMQAVNASNAAQEQRTAKRRGKPYDPLTGFRPPRLIRNTATDGFKGYTLSEITCCKCGAVSRVVEAFNSLMLDVPTQQQRVQFARRHPNAERRTESGELLKRKQASSAFCWYNPLSYLYCIYQAITSFFAPKLSYDLTLQECLDIHFEAAELKGSNKYRCESCDRVCEATKQERIVSLPEYLLIHMKRFESGQLFGGKKNDPVIFPVSWSPLTEEEARSPTLPASANGGRRPEILDLRHYVHPDVARFLARAPPCLRPEDEESDPAGWGMGSAALPHSGNGSGSGDERAKTQPQPASLRHPSPLSAPFLSSNRTDSSASAPAAINRHLTSTYTLDGVVNHHGSIGGGHYTVYVRKVAGDEERWVYISDDAAVAADVNDVANSEEYLLLYKKQPIVEVHGAARELRDKARYYLETAASSGAGKLTPLEGHSVVYMSRPWLQRAAFLTDPGAIYNRMCYCNEADRARVTCHFGSFPVGATRVPEDVPHVHGPAVEWFYVPVEEEDYWAFFAAYGGDGPRTQAEVDALMADQQRFLDAVRRSGNSSGGSRAPAQ